ncbi:type II secretion system protein [Halarcobacter anaerophilus]|uniref:Prepilin-type cleavage/methylation domain-containing protein n=1 Tax=Halarcobacter anaerophilus TaxID=877500 RepID=A0A4Q0XVT1_9BACT|nr:type II secretion system protein [Halarcobacter anaerophilus]QDF28376.1 type II secretion/transformation system, G protein [Halarcobacter anaerophilus]RXJ61710.1 prepilin-type cleavage/methylation domain-containing protein [Halarcobacter anaerophilus]
MKAAFSLLELIFAIVIMGIIASFAIPKYMDTRDQALASTIQRDVVTAINSFQSYYLVNREIKEISDVITLNTKNWSLEENKMTFLEGNKSCVELLVDKEKISITVNEEAGSVCKELANRGIITQDIDLI